MSKYSRPTIYPPGSRKPVPAYAHWRAMNERCSENYKLKYPTYAGCFVSSEWSVYEDFYDWVTIQKGYGLRDDTGILHNLDKDLLRCGNLEYSSQTCVLLPPEINRFLVSTRSTDRELPLGVSFDRGYYRAGYSNRNLGRFVMLEDAVCAYLEARQDQALYLANKWVDSISELAYDSLINYNVRPYRNT